ncbi:MAG: LytTR family transcriptional regulator [Clostridiales bacterium]|nr:LytTR family transcriptional regulator [Clostridiales bacterium]
MNKKENRMPDFLKKLNQGRYKEAESFCPDSEEEELRDYLVKISAETKNISIYSFVRYMYEKTGEREWLLTAISVARPGLTWLRGGDSVALFHCRQLLKTEPGNKRVAALMEELKCIEPPSYNKVTDRDFFSALIQGDYETAAQICADRDLRGNLVDMACDTNNLCVYSFTRYMYEKTGEMKWLYTAETIAEIDMCWMEGGYAVALFHAREALEQEQTYKHYKGLLTFWMIPEKLVDDEEALEIASVVIRKEPDNDRALRVFKKNGRALPDIAVREPEVSEAMLQEINRGNYHKAAEYLQGFDEKQQNDILVRLQYQVKNGSIFVFLKYLHEETGDPRWDEPGRVIEAIFSAQRASGAHNCKVNKPELLEYEIRVVDRHRKKRPDFIIFGEGMNKEKVDYADLLLIQKEKNSKYVEFCTADQRFRKRISMEAAMEEARYHSFLLLNRGQAVNLRHVKSLAGDSLTLDDGTVISVSKSRLPEFSGCLERYWCSEENKKKN